jgi:hypothetical protein
LRVLEFWDQGLFDTVQRMAFGMVTQNTTDMPRFCAVVNENKEHNDSDGDNEKIKTEDYVFTKFYQGRSCRIEESTEVDWITNVSTAAATRAERSLQQFSIFIQKSF